MFRVEETCCPPLRRLLRASLWPYRSGFFGLSRVALGSPNEDCPTYDEHENAEHPRKVASQQCNQREHSPAYAQQDPTCRIGFHNQATVERRSNYDNGYLLRGDPELIVSTAQPATKANS